MTPQQPHRLNSWRIEAHCRHCDWQTLWYVNRSLGMFRSHAAALDYIAKHPHGPPSNLADPTATASTSEDRQ